MNMPSSISICNGQLINKQEGTDNKPGSSNLELHASQDHSASIKMTYFYPLENNCTLKISKTTWPAWHTNIVFSSRSVCYWFPTKPGVWLRRSVVPKLDYAKLSFSVHLILPYITLKPSIKARKRRCHKTSKTLPHLLLSKPTASIQAACIWCVQSMLPKPRLILAVSTRVQRCVRQKWCHLCLRLHALSARDPISRGVRGIFCKFCTTSTLHYCRSRQCNLVKVWFSS